MIHHELAAKLERILASRVRKLAGVAMDRRGFAVGLEAEVWRADVRRDIRLTYRHDFGSRFAIDISTLAGTARLVASPMKLPARARVSRYSGR